MFVVYFNSVISDYDSESPSKITLLPYYGGAKGQTLQITELANGSVAMEIIQTPQIVETTSETSSETSHPSELEMPQLPARPNIDYGTNIRNIHQTALNIIKLQEAVKRHGQLSEAAELEYRENLDSLNIAAENLAKLQDNEDEDDLTDFKDRQALSSWFERKKTNKVDKDKKKEEEKRKEEERKKKEEEKRKEEEEKRKEEEEKKKEEEEEEEENKRKEEEEKRKAEKEKEEEKEKEGEKGAEKEEEEEEEEEKEDNDSVAVNLPPEDASVAEAKPVGLAIAGIGGVAASKPIATAVVGPGGLAIARPVGTAIAGVSPDQALVPIYAEEDEATSNKKKGQKGQNKGEKKKIGATEYLNRIISKYHQV